MPTPKRSQEQVRQFLATAHERWKLSAEAESDQRKEAEDDFKFRLGEQWPDQIKTQREADSRPCLTMNRLPAQIKQVTNEQRQQRPALNVNPVGDGADIDTADVLRGMIRHIEVQSDAEIAYDHAFESMVTGGFGYFRVRTEYIDGTGFDQEIVIDWIENPFSVFDDPGAQKYDRSDRNFLFVVSDPTPDEYKAQYPDSEMAGIEDFNSTGNSPAGWVSATNVRVAEYFYVDFKKTTVKGTGPDGQERSREVLKRTVKWAKINAKEILEETEIPIPWIPVVGVYGDMVSMNGKRVYSGLVRGAKDPQRQINFWTSAATEMVALAPKAPWVAAEGQLEGYEQMWATSNVRNVGVLPYKAVDVNGKAAPPPQRQAVEPPIQAMMGMLNQAANDLKAVTGLYDPSLGMAKSDQSGKAIQSLQKQGDIGTLNYSDNLSRSMRFAGRVILAWIPFVYDVDRVQRIVKPDQTTDMVQITNSRAMQNVPPQVQADAGQPAA